MQVTRVLYSMKPVKDFLGKPAPAGYVAGAGRHGFTTRPDAAGNALGESVTRGGLEDDSDDERGLFARAVGNEDIEDLEADAIFDQVDKVMASRVKRNKAKKIIEQNSNKPSSVFEDLKPHLQQVSLAEWAAIPEAGNSRGKKARKEVNTKERYIPLPDTLLMSNTSTNATIANTADSVDLSGLERARTLVKGMLKANPDHPDTWLAAIRLERTAGRLKAARSLCKQAIDRIQDCAELWMEFATISGELGSGGGPEQQRQVLMDAVKHATTGDASWEPIFMSLVDCEETRVGKLAMMRKALAILPNSAPLWSRIVELSESTGDNSEQTALLQRACEACPRHVDFWMKLSRLYTDNNDSILCLQHALSVNTDSIPLWLEYVRRINDNSTIQSMIEACNITIDTSLPHCEESKSVYKYLLSSSSVDLQAIASSHVNEFVRQCALEMMPDQGVLFLPSNPTQQDFERYLDCGSFDVEERERVWLQYIKYCKRNHNDILADIIQRASMACPDSASITYQKCLIDECAIEAAAVKFRDHEGIQLLFATNIERLAVALKNCPKSVHLWARACLESLNRAGQAAFRATWEKARKAVGKQEPLLWAVYITNSPLQSTMLSSALQECPKSGLLFFLSILFDQNTHTNEHTLKSRVLEAMRRYPPDDPFLPLLVGEVLLKMDGPHGPRHAAHFEQALLHAGRYADVYARLMVLMPEWEDRVRGAFVEREPTISFLFPDRISFDMHALVTSVSLL